MVGVGMRRRTSLGCACTLLRGADSERLCLSEDWELVALDVVV